MMTINSNAAIKKTDPVDKAIAIIIVFNFAWLAFEWLNPYWRNYLDLLKRLHLEGTDAFAVLALTAISIILLILQLFRARSPERVIHWKLDLFLVAGWILTFIIGMLTHLPAG